MPNYDFRCAECGHKFEVQVSMNDRDKVTCPDCGGKKVEQLFTGCMVNTGSSDSAGCGFDCGMPGAGFGGGCGMPGAGGEFGGG
ncbi:Zinc ribbon domain protein [Sporotomaculum syntrophicum]|uniref:Zinc ribbon domain protein n=1 Tax=Sporotomaculum syntrophicum TaxID=182264 RepID=A0A9D3AXD7_9FIRM|nr:zinc ribbon domain-containing protein [Sporotomaculum syntrophicum]KAF1086590.1 Zinc ribbon domain protein [Sporotomaculum syntrophicum]